jgi:hypothetical protein
MNAIRQIAIVWLLNLRNYISWTCEAFDIPTYSFSRVAEPRLIVRFQSSTPPFLQGAACVNDKEGSHTVGQPMGARLHGGTSFF